MTNVIIKTDKSPGVCVELLIERLEYYDKDTLTGREKQPNLPSAPKGFSTKLVEISKVTLSLEEVWSRPNTPKPLDPIQQSSVVILQMFHLNKNTLTNLL